MTSAASSKKIPTWPRRNPRRVSKGCLPRYADPTRRRVRPPERAIHRMAKFIRGRSWAMAALHSGKQPRSDCKCPLRSGHAAWFLVSGELAGAPSCLKRSAQNTKHQAPSTATRLPRQNHRRPVGGLDTSEARWAVGPNPACGPGESITPYRRMRRTASKGRVGRPRPTVRTDRPILRRF
jgi:hypothetical protein